MQQLSDRSRPHVGPVVAVVAAMVIALTLQSCTWAASSSGSPEAISPVAARDLSSTGRVGSQFFGLHAPALATTYPKTSFGAVNLTTDAVYWPNIETSPGHFDFTRLDALVNSSLNHHAKPLLVLGRTPTFHSKQPGSATPAATVPDLTAWKTYVAHVVNRYGARIDYEIWPEPNIIQNWTGTPGQMAILVAAAAKIIHQKAHAATVLSPAVTLRLDGQRLWMSKFFSSRIAGKRVGSFVDAVGIDPYPLQEGTPEDSVTLIQAARKILKSHSVTAPLWNVEINYGVAGGGSTIHHHSSPSKQASYVIRTYVLNAANGVRRVYWLGWGHFDTMDVQLTGTDGTTKTKAGQAFGLVRHWLLGQTSRGCQRNAKTHVYTCSTVRRGQASYIFWSTSGKHLVRAPAGVRHVQAQGGDVSNVRPGKRIIVTSAPVRAYH